MGVDILKRFAIRSGYLYENEEEMAYKKYDGKMINIGAGSFSHPRWINLDVSSDHYAQIQSASFVEYDLTSMSPMPFDKDELALAYCSHTIEHIKNNHVLYMFKEVYRCLKVGGVIRITCPNADLIYWMLALLTTL